MEYDNNENGLVIDACAKWLQGKKFFSQHWQFTQGAQQHMKHCHLLQLPSTRSVKMYVHSNVEVAGEAEIRLADERENYDATVAT